MISLEFLRNNPEIVKENIKKKFQFHKLELVDKAIDLDKQVRALKQEGDSLRASRNTLSSQIGLMMKEKKVDEANRIKEQVVQNNKRLVEIEGLEENLSNELNSIMMTIPNIIADDVPIGEDDLKNVEEQRFLEPTVPSYEIPYHADIIEALDGADFEAARRTSGTGFYYLCGDIARLQSAILSYARDFMINKGFIYCIPPFMIHGNVVEGVMSFDEMQNMMYKIEGEDLYLIGTSEHSMIGRYMNTIIPEEKLPLKLTSFSPCFRKEIGAHGIEERGIYRVHQFEKQEMIVICKPEESEEWYKKMWNFSVEFFTSMDIPVRTLVCCSGDLADLKYRSLDVEAWSPRQKKYFEVCSCSNLTDAQARRLKIRYKDKDGANKLVHTLNNTVVAPPRMLIAFLENHYQQDGTITIPEVLQPYMGGTKIIKKVN